MKQPIGWTLIAIGFVLFAITVWSLKRYPRIPFSTHMTLCVTFYGCITIGGCLVSTP